VLVLKHQQRGEEEKRYERYIKCKHYKRLQNRSLYQYHQLIIFAKKQAKTITNQAEKGKKKARTKGRVKTSAGSRRSPRRQKRNVHHKAPPLYHLTQMMQVQP
jgi:hypothetical protein